MATKSLTPAEHYARELTERIRHATLQLSELLSEAYEGQHYRSLGYGSWRAYIDGEFDFTSNYAYRLVKQGATVKMLKAGIAEVLPDGNSSDEIHITEAQARDIAPVFDAVMEEVRSQVGAGVGPSEAVETAVARGRQSIRRVPIDGGEFIDEVPEHIHSWVCSECGEVMQ